MKGIITHRDNIQEDIARYRYIEGDIAMVKKDWRTNCMDENDTTKMTKNVIRTLRWTFLKYHEHFSGNCGSNMWVNMHWWWSLCYPIKRQD